ncbi:MAG: hypothetical protein ACRC6M_00850 [Microcystaceae cyanobacterium]
MTKCSDCNCYDTSIPESSPYKFCLMTGNYLGPDQLGGCEHFHDVIPYQPPAKTRRDRGDGTGGIEKQRSNGTDQFWFAYEIHEDGKCLVKTSVYIPKGKLGTVRAMNDQKRPISEILDFLGKGKLQGDNSSVKTSQVPN